MPFTVTVHLPRRRARSVEVEIDLPRGRSVSVGELTAALAGLLGEPVPGLRVAGEPLRDDAVVGIPPFVHGAEVLVGVDGRPRGPGSHPSPARTPLDVVVVSGPDAGHRLPLSPDGLVVGRGEGADLVLDDPDLSRRHLRLAVTADGVLAEDLGSVNGSRLDGRDVTGTCCLPVGGRVRIGSTTLLLRPGARARMPTDPDGRGRLEVRRVPRVRPPETTRTVEEPPAPAEPRRGRLPLVAALAPLPVSFALAVALGPHYLLIAAGAPVLVLATALGDRVGSRRTTRREHAAYAGALVRARDDLQAALAEEVRERRAAHPDPAEVLALATGPGPRLWERSRESPDALEVRVGTAPRPARTSWTGRDRAPEHPVVEDVPVTVDLSRVGTLGVVGPPAAATDVVRAMVGRLATALSPHDLRIEALGGSGSWAWVDRLPHAGSEHEPASATTEPDADGPWRVRVVDLTGRCRSGPDHLHTSTARPDGRSIDIVLGDDLTALPAGCGAILEVAARDGSRLRVDGALDIGGIVAERPHRWWSERISRALAPLRDARVEAAAREGPPDSVRLVDVLSVDAADPAAIRAGWAAADGPVAVLGATQDGPWRLDLRREGPHALVGGTTGAGKSELLQALVASLAILSPPEALSIVLVDYKGGSAFAACADLPHVVGLVTDLDEHLAARALTSLRAELGRRERILASVGARDLEDYLAHRGPDQPTLGRLVIVVDELRALAEELPGFVDGIVRIAAVGRSLGVHLVLATQRPGGVVSPEIRANVNLRIALRVRDQSDSHDVIDLPDAALVPADRPGRGLARSGADGPVVFQGARVSAPAPAREPDRLHIRLASPAPAGLGSPSGSGGRDRGLPETRPTDLDRIVAAARAAHEGRDTTLPPRPWLPVLPSRLPSAVPDPREPAVSVGLEDHPGDQRQVPLWWDPSAGHWLLAGGPRSGRTTTAMSIATAAAARWGPDELHVHAIAPPGGFSSLGALPHVGTLVGTDDPERLDRLLTRLADEVRQRAVTGQGARPALLLIVDGWERATDPDLLGGTVGDRLSSLLRDGGSVGLTAVVTGDRSLLLGRMTALAAETFVLRLADPVDAALVGLDRTAVPHDPPPGRAIRARDGVEVQIALPHAASGQGPMPAQGGRRPLRVAALPTVLAAPGPGEAPPWTVGRGGDDGAWVALDPDRVGRLLLVAGPRGSGRTMALGRFASLALEAGRRVALVSTDGSVPPGTSSESLVLATPHDVGDLVAARRAHPDLVVLVDDADGLAGTPAEPVLDEIAALVDRDRGLLVVAATPGGVLGQIRGVVAEAARRHRGLLLAPSGPADGALLGIAVPRGLPAGPGRGFLVGGGPPVRVQVCRPRERP